MTYPGVHFYKLTKRWTASIYVDGKRIHLGYFQHQDAAIGARMRAEAQYSICRHFPADYVFSPSDWCYLFAYDNHNGRLFNRVSRPNGAHKGAYSDESLSAQGYRVITVQGRHYRAHRIVWEIHYGPIQDGLEMDHINRVRHDNRLENLRLVTSHENNLNLGPQRNKSGVTGVVYSKKDKRWQAQIGFQGKHIYLGQFPDFDSAVSARRAAEIQYGFRR